jgi:hypothetical protein
LAATGGTPAYTWSTVSSGGALPPGLTLASTGAISGTPTTAGTYSFAAQAADSGAQIAQKVFSVAVAAAPTPPPPTTSGTTPLFQTGFEPTDPTFDTPTNTTTAIVNTNPAYVHSGGSSLQLHYTICGAKDGSCGASSQDQNLWLSKVINPGLTHFFTRGYVYFKTPEAGATQGTIMQRKIMWFSDDTSPGGSSHPGPDLILNTWTGANGAPINQLSLTITENASACSGPITNVWDIYRLNWNTWYSIENEIQLNTSGNTDGVWRIWVNGTQVYNGTGLNLVGTCGNPISFFSVGRQTNRGNYDVVDEYRYWDDVVISQSYIGP